MSVPTNLALENILREHLSASNKLIELLAQHLEQCRQMMAMMNFPRDHKMVLEEILRQDEFDLEFLKAYTQDLKSMKLDH